MDKTETITAGSLEEEESLAGDERGTVSLPVVGFGHSSEAKDEEAASLKRANDMPDLGQIFKAFIRLWSSIGPLLGFAFGFIVKWLFDQLSGHLAAKRDHRKMVTEIMVPRLHGYTEQFYAPEGSYARMASTVLRAMLQSPGTITEEQLSRAMFGLGKLHSKEFEQIRTIGGFFFQDLTGEAVVSVVQNDSAKIWRDVKFLNLQQRAAIREGAGKSESIAEFEHHLGENLDSLRKGLKEWLANDPDQVRELCEHAELYSKLLLMEVNWAYQDWYRDKYRATFSQQDQAKLRAVLALLEQRGDTDARRNKAYLKKLRLSP